MWLYYCACVLLIGVANSAPVGFKGTDVIFVLDGSESVGEANFNKVKSFVKRIGKDLLAEKGSNVNIGVIQYSQYYQQRKLERQPFITTEIQLSSHVSASNFKHKVDGIKYQGYHTFTAAALRRTLVEFEKFGRKDACKIAVIVTDGRSEDRQLLEQNSNDLSLRNIRTIAVGVANVDDVELKMISSGNIYSLDDYKSTNDIITSVTTEIQSCRRRYDQSLTTTIVVEPTTTTTTTASTTTTSTTTTAATTTARVLPTDVMFILDGSFTMKKHFSNMKMWVDEIAHKLNIEDGFVRAGVIEYSHWNKRIKDITKQPFINTEIAFGNYQSYQDFSEKLGTITPGGYKTYTAYALERALYEFKTFSREEACKVAVVISDGSSQDETEMLRPNAQALRDADVNTISIGYTNTPDADQTKEFRVIASGDVTSSENVVMLHDVIDETKVDEIVEMISSCSQHLVPSTNTPLSTLPSSTAGATTTSKVTKPIEGDVVFLVDGSGSIPAQTFDKVKSWMKKVASLINLDDGLVNVGVIQYSYWFHDVLLNDQPNMETEVVLGQNSYTKFIEEVDNIQQQGQGTSTGHALEKLMYDLSLYGRRNVCKFAVILTDENSSDVEYLETNLKALWEAGVITFAVGVGESVSEQLQQIASVDHMGEKRLFLLKDFDSMSLSAEYFTDQLTQC